MEDIQKYLDKAFKYLSFRPRSEKEVRDKLKMKKAPSEIIDKIITQLVNLKFLDDEKFAQWWIEQRTQFSPRGERVLKLELRQKGISQDVIESALQNTEDIVKDDLESAKKLVRKKLDRYKHLSRQKLYQKLGAYLARRGFDWQTIKKSIDSELNRS